MNFIPDTAEANQNTTFCHYVYLHRQAERLAGTDLCRCNTTLPDDTGVYPCTINGLAAFLFIWATKRNAKGLVVLAKDKKGLTYAHKVYKQRKAHI